MTVRVAQQRRGRRPAWERPADAEARATPVAGRKIPCSWPLMVLPALAVLALTRATAPPPVGLIIDTDIGGGGCQDVDDVVAVCIANALADNGEAALLAVVQNT